MKTINMRKIIKISHKQYTGRSDNATNEFIVWRGQMVSLGAKPRIFALEVKTAYTNVEGLIHGVEVFYPDNTSGGRVLCSSEKEAYAALGELELILLHAKKVNSTMKEILEAK